MRTDGENAALGGGTISTNSRDEASAETTGGLIRGDGCLSAGRRCLSGGA